MDADADANADAVFCGAGAKAKAEAGEVLSLVEEIRAEVIVFGSALACGAGA